MKSQFLFLIAAFVLSILSNCYAENYKEIITKAETFYKEGKYVEASETYEKAFKTGKASINDYYNAACAASLAKQSDIAFKNLNLIAGKGFTEIDWIIADKDFQNIKKDKRWEEIIKKVKKNVDDINDKFPDEHKVIETVKLPEPELKGNVSIEETISERRSIRKYKDKPLTLKEVSQILWAAYGITKPVDGGPEFLRGGLRAAPSAGALYPLDIYIVVGHVTGLAAGVYLYDSENHSLQKINDKDKREKLSEACYGTYMVQNAPAVLVYSAIFERTTSKYGQRGRDRYVCMDLGHSAENVYLQAGALSIGTCAVGAFRDLSVKQTINMTKKEEPLYIMPIGKIK